MGILHADFWNGLAAILSALKLRRNRIDPSFRGDAKHRTRNLEIPGLVLAHHPGMTGVAANKKAPAGAFPLLAMKR
jgi:hypothetical protein